MTSPATQFMQENCALSPYFEADIGPFKKLDDLLMGDAGKICQQCPFLRDCRPSITQTCDGLLLLTQSDAENSF